MAPTALSSIRRSLTGVSFRRVEEAHAIAVRLYGDRLLPMTEDVRLIEHVEQVLKLLVLFCPDEDAYVACLLQHSLQSPDYSLGQLEEQFGYTVKEIVSRLSVLSHLSTVDWRRSIDDLKVMLITISDDVRVILLKLAHQCFLIENVPRLQPSTRARLARESLSIFAPVAARLGIYALKYRMEDHAFPVAYPTDADHIYSQLTLLHETHGQFLFALLKSLGTFLTVEGMKANVEAREKHPYSIFQKMQRKSVTSIEKIQDLFAVRVITDSVSDCYQVLGLIHRLATPLTHRFKDYISFPKPNGYQSLHTCLLGLPGAPRDLTIEVQIRTREMHRAAEYGIAAHWLYKERSAVGERLTQMQLSDVLLKQQSVSRGAVVSGRSLADQGVLVERLIDHIYVLTPRGDLVELPEGATTLDFAFAIHTDLGLTFRSARVNGSIAPLGVKLENGDVVEVLTRKNPRPSMQWMNYLSTSSAKNRLKAYFSSHHRREFLDRGKEALNTELKERKLPLLDAELSLLKIFDGIPQSMRDRENLLVKLGMGSVRVSSVFRHLALRVPAKRPRTVMKPTVRRRLQTLVEVENADAPMPFLFAKCCGVNALQPKSVPLIGFITRAGKVSVHKQECRMMHSANPERRVRVRWV